MRRLARALALVTVLAAAAGCVYYPTVSEVGGTRIQPRNGRAVRQGEQALFYAELASTGRFGDVLMAASTPAAREALIVTPAGVPVARLEIPGGTVVVFGPGGPHVVLSGLTRELRPGDVIIVTLVFQKFGNLGVVTVVE